MARMNTTAPIFTTSDTILAMVASCGSAQSGRRNSLYRFRVKRLAQAMDMIAAGTSAPMAMLAKATPTNQDGKDARNSAGTAKLAPYWVKPAAYAGSLSTPAAMAM